MIALDAGGRLLDDQLVDELAAEPALTLLCGRYEGFDERVLEHFCSDRISIGRYVLAGGELPAMVLCDAVLRKLPGSLGHEHSALEESFSAALQGGPEYPHYTRPAEHRGWRVPEVLLSGHHAQIAAVAPGAEPSATRPRPSEASPARPSGRRRRKPVCHRDRGSRAVRYHSRPHGRVRALRGDPEPGILPAQYRSPCKRGRLQLTYEHSYRQLGAQPAPPRTGVRRR